MKQRTRKWIAFLMAAVMVWTAAFSVSAADAPRNGTAGQHLFDKVWDKLADTIIGSVSKLLLTADSLGLVLKDRRFPTVAEYESASHDGFYAGTDGAVSGDGWKLGYSGGSVIPTAWRLNAAGEARGLS